MEIKEIKVGSEKIILEIYRGEISSSINKDRETYFRTSVTSTSNYVNASTKTYHIDSSDFWLLTDKGELNIHWKGTTIPLKEGHQITAVKAIYSANGKAEWVAISNHSDLSQEYSYKSFKYFKAIAKIFSKASLVSFIAVMALGAALGVTFINEQNTPSLVLIIFAVIGLILAYLPACFCSNLVDDKELKVQSELYEELIHKAATSN